MVGSDDPEPAQAGYAAGTEPAQVGHAAGTPLGGRAGRRLAVTRPREVILAGDATPGQRPVEVELAGMLARRARSRDGPSVLEPAIAATSGYHNMKQLHNVR